MLMAAKQRGGEKGCLLPHLAIELGAASLLASVVRSAVVVDFDRVLGRSAFFLAITILPSGIVVDSVCIGARP